MSYYGKTIYNEIRKRKSKPHIATWENFMQTHVPDGCVIHHIDGNKFNHDILNLVCMEKNEHDRWHAKKRIYMFNHGEISYLFNKYSRHNKGKKLSDETKMKISIGNKGKHHSLESRQKISLANKGKIRELITCPYCNKVGAVGPMNRWHFDNCKKNV